MVVVVVVESREKSHKQLPHAMQPGVNGYKTLDTTALHGKQPWVKDLWAYVCCTCANAASTACDTLGRRLHSSVAHDVDAVNAWHAHTQIRFTHISYQLTHVLLSLITSVVQVQQQVTTESHTRAIMMVGREGVNKRKRTVTELVTNHY